MLSVVVMVMVSRYSRKSWYAIKYAMEKRIRRIGEFQNKLSQK